LAQYQRDREQYKVDYAAWLEQQQNAVEQNQYVQQEDYGQPEYEQPEYQEPSPKAQNWASANEWFGTDTVMTNVAFAIHNDLIQSGVDLESDEYYAQIDSRMRQELPHKFNGQTNARGNTNVQTVVSGSRTTGSGRNQNSRRVELNPSEQALARKLGVPFKEYAKQKMRLQNS